MDASVVNESLARHTAGQLSDDALIERIAGWLRALPRGAEDLRRLWPVERLPALGGYLCVERLGEGASGVVYSAVQLTKPPQMVALKLLRLVADDEKRRFFEREVEILKALRCPHVARYLDSGSAGGSPYLAMELVRGLPLDAYLAAHAPTLTDKLAVFEKVAAAVAELHDTGVIHRDLTPRHIIVDDAGEVRIVDLGLSAVRTPDWATQVRRTQTRLGRIVGTLKYMSPEQAWGGLYRTDQPADIWALGVMLFEVATDGGYPYSLEPLTGMTPADALLYRIQNETPARPCVADESLAPALNTLIARCLAHEPQRRIASARALAEDLARLSAEQRIATRPLPVTYRLQRIAIGLALRARTALWSAIILATLGLLFALVFLFNVHWISTADAYSSETQERLIKAAHPRGAIDIRIAGISDATAKRVPVWAAEVGLADVSADVRTWRGVHGLLMERLAVATPLMVVWDYYFKTPRPEDAAFVAGVRALDNAGVPVVVGVRNIRPDGRPDLSPSITEPLGGTLHHGLIIARDMVQAPGEYVVTLGRDDRWHPALIVSAFGALCYPKCQVDIHWPKRQRDIQIRYHRRGTSEYLKALDDIPINSHLLVPENSSVQRKGDLLAFAGFPLAPLESWRERTIPYEELLTADADELAERVGGRVLVIADMRSPTWFAPGDLHRVRFNGETVDDVPGGYLLANGIAELLANRRRVSRLPLLAQSLGMMIGMAIVGCLLAVLLGRRLYSGANAKRRWRTTVPVWTAVTIALTACLTRADAPVFVQIALAGAAMLMALGPALAIEYTRCQRLVRAPEQPPDGAEQPLAVSTT